MNVYFLHGFLGMPSDFECVMRFIEVPSEESHVLSVDYTKFRETSPQVSLDKWGAQFNRWVESYEKGHSSQKRRVLVGYSQGGRLALHAWKANPTFWQGLVLISANPGITAGEKPARLKSDDEWAQRFQNDNFAKTVEKWNAQPVLQGTTAEPPRKEGDYNRHLLVTSLKNWSLALQQDFRADLAEIAVPTLYISGEKDPKYTQFGQELSRKQPLIQAHKISDSGHRVLFDAPETLAKLISEFIGKLK